MSVRKLFFIGLKTECKFISLKQPNDVTKG